MADGFGGQHLEGWPQTPTPSLTTSGYEIDTADAPHRVSCAQVMTAQPTLCEQQNSDFGNPHPRGGCELPKFGHGADIGR